MKPVRVTLYDFMPYGAPELLEVQTRHLTRAMATATTGMAAAFAIAVCLFTWFAQHPGAQEVPVGTICTLAVPPSILDVTQVVERIVLPSITPLHGVVPVPVRDSVAPPDVVVPTQETLSQQGTTDAPTGPVQGIAPTPSPVEAPPSITDFVIFEEAPAVVSSVVPVYPDIAREAGVDGTVRLRVLVGTDGRVKDVHVDKSIPLLDEAAVAAARKWVFTPAISNHRPVMVWVAIPIHFSLH